MERAVRTPGGRTLAVEDAGDPAGRVILVHGGTPNSRHLYGPNVADAAARGLRLISYDRPGYGGSTSQPGRSIADCAGDVRAICAALEIGRLAMWGISGGGAHLLACAALLPDLVAAAASLASLAPYGAEGLDWFAGMGPDDVADNRLLLTDPQAARAKIDKDREGLLTTSASDLAQPFESVLSPADAAVLDGGMAEFLTYYFHEGLVPGSQGWWDDACAHVRPWGSQLSDIAVPVLVLHGRQDKFVPFGHGQWLVTHVPGAEARLLDDDGHLTLLAHRVGEVHLAVRAPVEPDSKCRWTSTSRGDTYN
jgi:pimeloyl-ACP methyl ester carboxylesterase